MSVLVAITRAPSARLAECELSFLDREPIDVSLAREQHRAYQDALRAAGACVIALPPLDTLPDATFVEDTAIVLDDLAVLAPMGAGSRRRESAVMADELCRYREVRWLTAPATLDGGDVLHLGRTLYVGQTPRTNAAATVQLRAMLCPLGYTVVPVPVTRCLHLKSACGRLDDATALVNPDWVHPATFEGARTVAVAPGEPWGANVVRVGETVIVPANAPATAARLSREGYRTATVDVSELQKAEAGVSCMSLIFEAPERAVDGRCA